MVAICAVFMRIFRATANSGVSLGRHEGVREGGKDDMEFFRALFKRLSFYATCSVKFSGAWRPPSWRGPCGISEGICRGLCSISFWYMCMRVHVCAEQIQWWVRSMPQHNSLFTELSCQPLCRSHLASLITEQRSQGQEKPDMAHVLQCNYQRKIEAPQGL